jgi:hypothetical protein
MESMKATPAAAPSLAAVKAAFKGRSLLLDAVTGAKKHLSTLSPLIRKRFEFFDGALNKLNILLRFMPNIN